MEIRNKYVYIKKDEKRILEHVYVVEKFIGYKLKKGWVVHHINLKKYDNRICNLMIFKSQKKHASFHIKFKKYGFSGPVRLQIRDRWIGFKN